jgi:hypothetical protein
MIDVRFKMGYSIISRLDLNGKHALQLWKEKIGFLSPKHLDKIKKNSGGWTSTPSSSGFEPSTSTPTMFNT